MKIGKAVRETVNWKPNVTPALGTEQFKINGQIVEKVDRFKLLGSWTLAKGKVNEHIKKRMQAAYDPIQGLNDDRLKLWYIFSISYDISLIWTIFLMLTNNFVFLITWS